nr:hypothetical protein [Tanacetum cinerariifolium]
MNMKKIKRPTVRFLVLVVVCFHLIAYSNCFKVVHAIGTKKELEVDKSAVNFVGRRGGGGGGHGGGGHGGGGHSGGSRGRGSRGSGGYRGSHVIPVYIAGGHQQAHHGRGNSSSSNSITISQYLVSTMLALVLLLT